jgi:hypothetical protein
LVPFAAIPNFLDNFKRKGGKPMDINIEKILIPNSDLRFPEVKLEPEVLPPGLSDDPSHIQKVYEEYLTSDFILTSEDHGTIRIKNEAGRYRVSMVIKTLEAKYFAKGLGFKEYWILLELASYIQGNKAFWEIKDEYERHLVFIAMLILRYGKISGFREQELVDLKLLLDYPELKVKVTNPRIYDSLKENWHWSRIVIVSIVPVDSQFLVRDNRGERYNSYTKGYGEGSSRARIGKTPVSAELDGEDFDEKRRSLYDDHLLHHIFIKLIHMIFGRKHLGDSTGSYF